MTAAKPQTEPISIHAPVKGATVLGFELTHLRPISIHAPVKGATQNGATATINVEFQSTLP